MACPRLASFVLGTSVDPAGLGRWSCVYVGTEERRTRLVSAYQPCRKTEDKPTRFGGTGSRRQRMTVWAQHRRYFRKRGIFWNPRTMFRIQLMAQLKRWRAAGDEIILHLDANEDLYTGTLAKELQGDGLQMTEQVLKSTGQRTPYSHHSGSKPILGTYATPGVVCIDSYVAPHGAGVGDHRLHLHDFCARSVLGIDYPKLSRAQGRKLRCKVERTVKNYNKVLKQLLLRHRAFDKLLSLQQNQEGMSAAEFQLELNRWDEEVTTLKKAAEKRCNQVFNGSIEYSSKVGIWLNRLRLYRWMWKFKQGQVPDPRNLFRQCKRHTLLQPRDLSEADVAARIASCMAELASLRDKAPEL